MDFKGIPLEGISHYKATIAAYDSACRCVMARHFGIDCEFRLERDIQNSGITWKGLSYFTRELSKPEKRTIDVSCYAIRYLAADRDFEAFEIVDFLETDLPSNYSSGDISEKELESALAILRPILTEIQLEVKIALAGEGFSPYRLEKYRKFAS